MSPRFAWNAAVLLVVASLGACGSEPEPAVRVDDAVTAWTAVDTACTTLRLTAPADGKKISLADAPLSCGPTGYASLSPGAYGQSGCDGYIVELDGVINLPRTGETVRVVDGLNPKASHVMLRSECEALTYEARAYVHTTLVGAVPWSRHGGVHRFTGKWNDFGCELIPAANNGEIPPFPAAVKRDRIRIVVKASSNGQRVSVFGGVKLGTCSPTPRPTGALCDANDECSSAFCAVGACCGRSDSERLLCTWQELTSS